MSTALALRARISGEMIFQVCRQYGIEIWKLATSESGQTAPTEIYEDASPNTFGTSKSELALALLNFKRLFDRTKNMDRRTAGFLETDKIQRSNISNM